MNRSPLFRICWLCLACMLIAPAAWSNVSLPAVFSDHLVVQQKTTIRLWGWAKPLEKITVSASWSQATLQTEANNQAHWEVLLETPAAGGPFEITIQGYNAVVIHDVLIGEVWLCSGQSNMEWSAGSGFIGSDSVIRQANYPNIRFFSVSHRTATSPQIDLEGKWVVCTPETMKDFSAIGYIFGLDLHQALRVPVGLINSSWGGTPAEAWMPEAAITSQPKLAAAAAELSPVPWGPVEVARIHNAMIAPLAGYPIAGALWYQGESNVGNGHAYTDMLTALIGSWRADWGRDFPFYFVQIAPWKYGKPYEGAALRDAQRRVLAVPGTGMVVTSDIGDTTDIHPRNKIPVGHRLADIALVQHYQARQQEVSGPLFDHVEAKGKELWVYFAHAGGLNAKGGSPDGFEVAGEDGHYVAAQAKIVGTAVVLEAKGVKQPVSVRYAWRSTATPNLFNGAGLPASCFIAQ